MHGRGSPITLFQRVAGKPLAFRGRLPLLSLAVLTPSCRYVRRAPPRSSATRVETLAIRAVYLAIRAVYLAIRAVYLAMRVETLTIRAVYLAGFASDFPVAPRFPGLPHNSASRCVIRGLSGSLQNLAMPNGLVWLSIRDGRGYAATLQDPTHACVRRIVGRQRVAHEEERSRNRHHVAYARRRRAWPSGFRRSFPQRRCPNSLRCGSYWPRGRAGAAPRGSPRWRRGFRGRSGAPARRLVDAPAGPRSS